MFCVCYDWNIRHGIIYSDLSVRSFESSKKYGSLNRSSFALFRSVVNRLPLATRKHYYPEDVATSSHFGYWMTSHGQTIHGQWDEFALATQRGTSIVFKVHFEVIPA